MLFRMQSYSIEATKIAAFLSFKGFSVGFCEMCILYIVAELYVNFDWEKSGHLTPKILRKIKSCCCKVNSEGSENEDQQSK